jgi:hypothetical protein
MTNYDSVLIVHVTLVSDTSSSACSCSTLATVPAAAAAVTTAVQSNRQSMLVQVVASVAVSMLAS